MMKFIKPETLREANTFTKLTEIDMESETVKRPDVGFAAYLSLRSLLTEQKKVFFEDCCRFYANIVQNILNFKFSIHASCLSPFLLNFSPALCESRMQHPLEELVRATRLSAELTDRAKSQFLNFVIN